ncbi:hypothetical protein N7U66_04435 [Lacinutrix neustonica]|uniref:PorT family protein n=1 Tax=Lacinutrix neustonica TaxID=2980107 RepID=A0A9E8SEM7_9FLAO|nr:hypothetical protein [Lacinutrix neustonica]WAC02882.1 hypothetical protein N7U66_04435 [Lacinutrix neustonica]
MKKLLFTAAIVALGFTTVNAQEVKFGAKAGVNLATIGGDAEDVDGLTSFHVGGVAEIMVSEKFSVQPNWCILLKERHLNILKIFSVKK